MKIANIVWGALLVAAAVHSAEAAPGQKIDFPLRGQLLSVTIYRPAGPPKGTVVMGSGDVGWVGLSVSMAEFLSDRGYVVAGVNSRQYLSAFTRGKLHLEVHDTPADFAALRDLLEAKRLLFQPVILSGVSEGAALAVLAAAHGGNHAWVDGVVTMGTPMVAALAWNWTDFTTWITKKDANQPSFSPVDFIGRISPVPLAMLQSIKDEYVPEADYRKLDATAGHPKRLVLIDASNHRFTDRQQQLRTEMLAALVWIADLSAKNSGSVQ